MLISIGTGTAPGRPLLGNLVTLADKLKDLVLDTEQTDRDFQSENRSLIRQGRFYRFNVDDGSMADIGIEEYQEASRIAANTNQYLEHPRAEEEVIACIDSLCKGGQRLGLLTAEGGLRFRVNVVFSSLNQHVRIPSCFGAREEKEQYLQHLRVLLRRRVYTLPSAESVRLILG